ncbi:MAG: glycosyltransferase family 2 protein, partial [Bryobacteraceae bacterium]
MRRVLRGLPLLLLSPLAAFVSLAAIALADLLWLIAGRRRAPADRRPSREAVSIVIPTWNGREQLERNLASVVAAAAPNPENEIIVVDNASEDGTAAWLAAQFPRVRLLRQERNLGFGGGSNAGFRAARHEIVVLLNNDMRVDEGFLAPLVAGFTDEKVFAVSCQIYFRDPDRPREETGLTQGWWENGTLGVRHRVDDRIRDLFPCFYGGGGSCAFDRRKFFELGGFDDIFHPFYLEDTDLGFSAWKRGWKIFFQPASIVWHEHRGTIGRRFTEAQIKAVLQKNFLLFAWKNIHEWPRLLSGFFFTAATGKAGALCRAFLQLPGALRSRWRSRGLAVIPDTEAFRRPLGGYFHDRFGELPAAPERLSVLFVSPYPICPPVHGGGVFMYQTLKELAPLCELHLIVLLDSPHGEEPHAELVRQCASATFLVRLEGQPRQFGSIVPFAIREFEDAGLDWAIHRTCYLAAADVLQLEYLPMGQY